MGKMSGGTGRHRSDPIKLLKIYEIYREWLKAMELNGVIALHAPTRLNVNDVIDTIDSVLSVKKENYSAEELDKKAKQNQGLWPKIVYGPVTLASDQYHTVLVILDPEETDKDAKERYVSKRFFNLIKWSWTRHDYILDLNWITEYLEPLAQELENEGLTRIQ